MDRRVTTLASLALFAGCFSPTLADPTSPASTSSSSGDSSGETTRGEIDDDDDETTTMPSPLESSGTDAETTGDASSEESGEEGAIVCDPYAPRCPADRKCTATGTVAWEQFLCMPIAPEPRALGEACVAENATSGVDDCDDGLICFGLDPRTDAGTCFAFCDGSAQDPACPEGETCILHDDFVPLCHAFAPGCGDGAISPGEQCDGADLQGFDCAALGLSGGELSCDPLQCVFDTSGCQAA